MPERFFCNYTLKKAFWYFFSASFSNRLLKIVLKFFFRSYDHAKLQKFLVLFFIFCSAVTQKKAFLYG